MRSAGEVYFNSHRGENPIHEYEHVNQMREIAEEIAQRIIEERAPVICAQIFNEAVERAVGAFTTDIHTAVNIAFDDGADIFYSERARQMVSNAICEAMRAEISNIKLSL